MINQSDDDNRGGWTENTDRVTELENKLAGIRAQVQEWNDALPTHPIDNTRLAGEVYGAGNSYQRVLDLFDGK